jgi:hypothetical protein
VPKGKTERREWLKTRLARRYAASADKHRAKLVELLGSEKGRGVKMAEAFEVCEYGQQPGKEMLLRLFPFFGGE